MIECRVTGFIFAGARSFGVSKGRGFSVLLPPLTTAQMGVEILRLVFETEGKDWSGRMDLNHRPPGPEPGNKST